MFVANVLKCRPPGNRDPLPQEIDACQDYLFRQLELIEPRVVCTLGNFATKLLRGDPRPASRACTAARRSARSGRATVRLYPLFHPAAALYTPSMLETLRDGLRRASRSCSRCEPPEQPEPEPEPEPVVPEPELVRRGRRGRRAASRAQLGLF